MSVLPTWGVRVGRDYLGNEMGRNEPAAAPLNARTKNRDEAIATALGSLIPTKAEQANPASRLPPLGPLNETSAFSAIRPGAPSPNPSAPSGLTAGGWPRAQMRQSEPVEAPKPRAEDPSQKRVEPVILAAMPVAKAAAEPPKPASPFGDSPALDASPREVKTAPVVLASQPNIAERYSKPEVLASMPAVRPAASEGPSVRVEAEIIKPEAGRGRPEILAAMPKPAATESTTSDSARRHSAVGLLPPLKPVDAPVGAKVSEVAPISTAVEEPRQADPAPKAAAEEVKPAIEEESAFDAISALGALAAGLAKSSSAPVVALAAVEEVKKTLPQAVNTADGELPPGPSIEAPVVRAGQASYAPVKPKLPEAPKFLAPAPAPTAEAGPVDLPPAALETPPLPAPPLPASPVEAAVEPQVDALAMLSAAMGTANPVDSAKAPAGIAVPPVLPLSAMLNSSSEPEDTPERTLEDTVAELLRPMLRQWLSDNMPRIVEKALRIEVAQSLRPGGKTRS